MGDHHHHTTVVYPIIPPPANTLHTFRISGTEAVCGCPVMCGCGTCGLASIGPVYMLPLEAQGIITMDEMHELVRDFDAILCRTHWPFYPLIIIADFIMIAWAYRREVLIKEEIAKVNSKLIPRGAHLEMAPPIRPRGPYELVPPPLQSGQAFMHLIRHPTPGQDPAMSMFGGQVPMAAIGGYGGLPGTGTGTGGGY